MVGKAAPQQLADSMLGINACHRQEAEASLSQVTDDSSGCTHSFFSRALTHPLRAQR